MKLSSKILVFFLFLFSTISLISFVQKDRTKGYQIGDKIADFNLKNVDGQNVSIANLEGKGVIVVFTCNTCPYSKLYEDRIIELHHVYATKGYPVIAINSNDAKNYPGDSFDNMVKRAKEKSYAFPYLYDESQKVATQFGATRTPHVYLLNKETDGLKVAYIGAIDNNAKGNNISQFYVQDAIDALLAGKEVPQSFTKAVGCTIKWKKS